MKISETKNFLSQLEQANSKGHYVTAKHDSHQYSVVDTKTDKTLNTAKIADIVEDCFESLKNDNISQNQRAQLMNKLKTQIKQYNKRVHSSKKWYQKIGSYFGIISSGEKKINSIAKQAEVERKTNTKAVENFEQLHENFTRRQEAKLAGDPLQEKKIYMRMFGGVGTEAVRDDNLEGFSRSGAIKSYIEDLSRYEATLNNSKVGLKAEINAMIRLLDNAYTIATTVDLANNKRLPLEDKMIIMRELQLKVMEDIQDLAEEGEVGDQFLIPGGYDVIKGTGHAVLFRITKTAEGKCSFTIINAGDGAKESTTAKGIGSSLLNMFTQTILNTNVVREQVRDIKYENVGFDHLDLPFVANIFDKQFDEAEEYPMQVIKDRIDSSLLEDKQVRKTTGREHSDQEIGGCTFKCISSWLKDSFKSEKEYNRFKAAHSEWDMEKLQVMQVEKQGNVNTSKYTDEANREKDLEEKRKKLEHVDAMVTEGQKVLDKRKRKAR